MDAMMYKIEGEDLYLIGTSEHSMIGKFKDQILSKSELPYTMTSYSPCFRKEKGAHGIEERGVYRIHQFEKQEMIVVCEPDDQARRLGIRIKGEKGNYYAHTLNNTVVAPPRMLIAFLENNYNPDGSINIPKALQPYMGGLEKIIPNN